MLKCLRISPLRTNKRPSCDELLREPALLVSEVSAGGIPTLALAAVVTRQRRVQLAALLVEVVLEDGAAVAQIGLHVNQAVAGAADFLQPERHHLHQSARAGGRDREAVEVALDLDH